MSKAYSARKSQSQSSVLAHRSNVHIGDRFGKLVVIGAAFRLRASSGRSHLFVVCQCDCGRVAVVQSDAIVTGNTSSCRCNFTGIRKPPRPKRQLLPDGYATHPLYGVWKTMKTRCSSPAHRYYHRYGGRGITVCQEWSDNSVTFIDWALANGWSIGLQIDRKDNDGNYEPSNCHFVTSAVNLRNTSRTIYLEAFGERKKLMEWADEPRSHGVAKLIRKRLDKGWPAERAIAEPISVSHSFHAKMGGA